MGTLNPKPPTLGAMGDGPDAWTPVNGGLTATNKLNRKMAEKLIGPKVTKPPQTLLVPSTFG